MALTSLMPSPTLKSAFSPYTESPSSPSSFSAVSAAYRVMQRGSAGSNSDKDSNLQPPLQSPYPLVEPSPVESHNSHSTEATDIDEEAQNHQDDVQGEVKSPDIEIISPAVTHVSSPSLNLGKIDTSFANRLRSDSYDDAPQSVIHAPVGFRQFIGDPLDAKLASNAPSSQNFLHPQDNKRSPPQSSSQARNRPVSAPSETSTTSEAATTTAATVAAAATAAASPQTPENNTTSTEDKHDSKEFTTPLNTQIAPVRHGAGSTPRASTKEEAEEERKRRRHSIKSNVSNASVHDNDYDAKIETMGEALRNLNNAEHEIDKLKAALAECWTLCNTLASLSAIHRERMFSFSGTGDMQEQAWKSCWRLCQKLYESRDEDHSSQVKPTLELCRDFCQALFEARHRGDEITDSILRVSFELNNHLYNTHDRNLPDVFRERTLDFYLTMCHRLMKQRTALPEETDALLRACWSLAEMLFSLRQSNRDKKPVDEELLCSAVQACWELCDLFREGWTQIRPERGTPRPVQRVFPMFPSQGVNSRPGSALSVEGTFHTAQSVNTIPPDNPETPTTIFDDRDEEVSPSEPQVPNILVLGLENRPASAAAQARVAAVQAQQQAVMTHTRWTSNGSVTGSVSSVGSISGFSDRTTTSIGISRALLEPSSTTSSVLPIFPPESEDPHLVRLKALAVKAAINHGFMQRQTTMSLPAFIKSLPSTTFGNLPWQIKLFESYRKLVLTDPTLRDKNLLPFGRRFSATEIARAVQWMSRNEQFSWFRDLYRLVFGFVTEEASTKKGVGIQL